MELPPGLTYASETVKQILTLSTAILTMTVTFAKDHLLKGRKKVTWQLGTSWVGFLLSILFGIWTMMALTGEACRTDISQANAYRENVQLPALLMVSTFFLGIFFTVIAGWRSISK